MSWLEITHKGVDSYEKAERLWSRVRSPHKGKPITGWLRMFKEGNGTFVFKMQSYSNTPDLCRLTPDNKLTFVAEGHTFRSHSQTLVSSLHRWLPFTTVRHKTGVYRIAGTDIVQKKMQKLYEASEEGVAQDRNLHYWEMYQHYMPVMRAEAYYFQGIEFDMISGECLNPQPDVTLVEKPEERKKWRRALSAFKKGIKARVRVHAFDGIIDQMWAERNVKDRWDWQQPHWDSNQWLDLLEHCIRQNEFPPELLKGLAQTTTDGYYMSSKPDGSHILKALDHVCNGQSVALRRRFGVFEDEPQKVA